MTVAPGDVTRVSCRFVLPDGSVCMNVYHYRWVLVSSILDATCVNTLAAQLNLAYDDLEEQIEQNVVAGLSYVDTVAWDGTKWEVTYNVGSFTPALNPTKVGDRVANQNAPFVVFNTSRPKTKGKKFLFGTTEIEQTGSVLSNALVNALVDYASDCMANAIIGALDYAVPGVPRATVNQFYDFASAVVTNVVGTQRRRRPGVGI